MANSPLETKLECESRLLCLIMQDTPPSPPTCKVVFVHSTLAAWLVSLMKTTLNTGKGGHIMIHASFFKLVGGYDGSIQIHLYTLSVQ
jgi:hypothetical protein